MIDPIISEAESDIIRYKRLLSDTLDTNVPREWVTDLLGTLESVLDRHAELIVAYEPDDHIEDEYLLLEDEVEDDWLPEDFGEPDETIN